MSENARKPATLLHIDDDENDAFFLRRAVRQLAIDYHWMPNGEAALTHLLSLDERNLPQLILLDIKMPVMNGFDFLEALVCRPTLQNIPVVMLSSSSHPADKERAQQLGAKGYLCKSATPSELTGLLAPILNQWCT